MEFIKKNWLSLGLIMATIVTWCLTPDTNKAAAGNGAKVVIDQFGLTATGLTYLFASGLAGIVGHTTATAFIDIVGKAAKVTLKADQSQLSRGEWHITHGWLSVCVATSYACWMVFDVQSIPGAQLKSLVICSYLGVAPLIVINAIIALIEFKAKLYQKLFT